MTIKTKSFENPKNGIFPKGLTHAIGQKMRILFHLFLVKTRLEIRFNNVLCRKKNVFLTIKGKFLKVLKIAFFQREKLNHAFGQNMQIFSLFVFALNKTRYKVK